MALAAVMAGFRRLSIQAIVFFIKTYRYCICPLLPNSCRFAPSCSSYALGCFTRHGLMRGLLLTTKRILRCHPFAAGGADPVPVAKKCCEEKKQKAST